MIQTKLPILQFFVMTIIAIAILLFPIGKIELANGSNQNAYPAPEPEKSTTYYTFQIHFPVIMNSEQLATPPTPSLSRYIVNNDWTYLHDISGCTEGTAANPDAFVFLDFGYPWIDGSTNPPTYGAHLLNQIENIDLHMDEIENAAKNYLMGYYACAPSGAHINVAIGINNFGDNTQLNNTVGQEWAAMIKRINDWVKSPPSYEDKIIVYGAMDIEPGFGVPNDVVGWTQGYDSYAGRQNYYNFGTCDGCPYKYGSQDHTDLEMPNGWNFDQLWYVSYALQSAHVFPEIYTKVDAPDEYYPAHEAYQWQNLKFWGATCSDGCIPSYPPYNSWRNIYFSGALTQYDSCTDPNNSGAQLCIDSYMYNSPAEGWLLFWSALSSDDITKQNLSFSSDMTWRH